MLGAIIGDIAGSRYEFNNIKHKDFQVIDEKCSYTDDSIMTLAICEILQNGDEQNKDKIISTIKKWGRSYPNAGYGGRFSKWLFSDDNHSYYSCGNGSAMRVSAVAWYSESEDEVIKNAIRVTDITHDHPEGIKGAVVTAMCIYYAKIGKSKEFIKEYALKQYPEIGKLDYETLVKTYSHNEEICQLTVPQAIYCFLISNDFEDCIKTTISIGGDCDTTAAISGAIAEAYYKYIPQDIINRAYKCLPKKKVGCNVEKVLSEFLCDKLYSLTTLNNFNDNTKYLGIVENRGNYLYKLNWAYSDNIHVLVDYIKYEIVLPRVINNYDIIPEGYITDEKVDRLFRTKMSKSTSESQKASLKCLYDLYKHINYENVTTKMSILMTTINNVYLKYFNCDVKLKLFNTSGDAINFISAFNKVESDDVLVDVFNRTYSVLTENKISI